jgi:predicted PurR-regulated permease PerM
MSREHLFAAFFFIVFIFLLYQFYRMFSFFAGPITWAALLAILFYPLQERLSVTLRGRRGLAAFLLTTAVIVIVMVPTVYLSALLASESVDFYHKANELIQSGRVTEMLHQLRASRLGQLWEMVLPRLESWHVDLASHALKLSNVISAFLVAQAPAAAANVLRFIANFFFTTFALFFFFRDGSRMVTGLRDLIPMERAHKDAILRRVYDTISAVVQGTLLTGATQGSLAGLGYWILGVPFAILLGGATAFFSLLPMGGPIVWFSVVLYLAAVAEYGHALLLFLWGLLIVSSADNVIRPIVIGGRTQIPTVYLFFGILGGLQAYGFLGIFLAPALIALLVAFLRIYTEEYAGGKESITPQGPR